MLTVRNSCHNPFYNQAFEEYVFETYRDENVVLLWQNDPTVVVGCHQNICREVRWPLLRELHVPVVRRMSGGGTVYHDLGNLNYTLMAPQDQMPDYDSALAPVIAALNDLSIPAQKRRSCDIAIGEQKISGSAQRVTGGRVLHHGTLLFDSDLELLDRITTHHKNDCFQTKGTVSAICAVTNIRDHLQTDMTLEEFRAELLQRLLSGGREIVLTADQEREVERLRDEKYCSWQWTWGKTPSFTYEKTGEFMGTPIRVAYSAKRGILSNVQVECEAFDAGKAGKALEGAKLDPEAMEQLCLDLTGKPELLNFFL